MSACVCLVRGCCCSWFRAYTAARLPGACALQKLVQGLHGSACLPGACALQYLVQVLHHATYSTYVATLCESFVSVSCNDCVLSHELCVHMRAGAR